MKNITSTQDKELQEDIKKLVVARIKAASDDLSISVGSTEYTKGEMLKSVENDRMKLVRKLLKFKWSISGIWHLV